MKLYQALTQIQIEDVLPDDAPNWKIVSLTDQPLNHSTSVLYHYLDAVLRPGAKHTENNLAYVTDPAFIGENFNFKSIAETAELPDFEAKMQFARTLVADLNRHLGVNFDPKSHEFQLHFAD